MLDSSFHQQVLMCVCVCALVSESASTWSSEFFPFGNMPVNFMNFVSFLEVFTRSSVRFS